MTESANSFLSRLEESGQVVWGDDAPEIWARMSQEPTVRLDGRVQVTSSAAVQEAMRQPELFSSRPEGMFFGATEGEAGHGLIPLQVDPPEHKRYRKMLDPLFAPKRMAAMEAELTDYVNRCIDAFARLGSCDFSEELAVPFPVGTFLRLLGLPYEQVATFIQLKDDQIRPSGTTPEEMLESHVRSRNEIVRIFNEALDARKNAPGDDILSYFAELEDSGQLTRVESLNICHLLLLAGLDTVTGTLEVAFGLLARRPDLQAAFDDPDIIPTAVEELLRWVVTSPAQTRTATRDTVLDGVPIAKGDNVRIVQATPGFDPNLVEEPCAVNLRRQPNNHPAFSLGVHRCLGSHLARVEMRVTLREWHRRIPRYRLADGFQIEYTPALRGIPHLALEFTPEQ